MKNGIVVVPCVVLILATCSAIAASQAICERLKIIKTRDSSPSVSLNEVKSEYLDILRDADSNEEKGAVLVQLVKSLNSRGGDAADVIKYSNEALHMPISPLEKCAVFDCWAATLKKARHPDADPKTNMAEIAEVYLKGIVVTLESTTTNAIQEPSSVGKFRYVGTSPEEDATKKREHEAEIKKREHVLMNNELLNYRAKFLKLYASLLPRNAAGRLECEKTASEHLRKYPEVFKELVRSVESEP